MALTEIAGLLKDTIGMDAASIGLSAVEYALKERLSACHLQDPHAYWEKVRGSPTELQALIEAVVVPETWFLRDPGAFTALARIARDEWSTTGPDVVRLLSLPSSTGEEPYSMAMALLDAGFPAHRFRIDAIDISGRVLARAERAVYGMNSFRGNGMTCRDRHFESTPQGYRLNEEVRRQVTFRQGNLLSPTFTADGEFDVIFCRNLLIYFDRATQDRAITTLGALLKTQGLLFVGSAESGVFLNRAFASAQLPMAFAFRRATIEPRRPKQKVTRRASPEPTSAPPARRITLEPTVLDESTADVWRSVGNQLSEPHSEVEEAVQLANQGRFVEAAVCCEEHLRLRGPSPEAFYLLGLVRDASGNPSEAAAYYRKALYLDPGHQETIVHLALLMDKQGHTAQAQVLWNRARRLSRLAAG